MYDVIVIGGGQAGLATGYYLKQAGLKYVVLEANSAIGEVWRNRWDGLRLFTPNRYNSLPDYRFPGENYDLPDRLEVAAYFEHYVQEKELNVQCDSCVISLSLKPNKAGFGVSLKNGQQLEALQVVLACGAYRTPKYPAFAQQLSGKLPTLHTCDIRDPLEWLPASGKRILVVGAGASGSQVASILAQKHTVILSGRDPGHLPRKLLGRDVYDFLYGLKLIQPRVDSLLGRALISEQGKGEIRVGKSVDELAKLAGFERKPRVSGVEDGQFNFADGTSLSDIDAVVFATGYANEYPFINVPDALDQEGKPIQKLGKSPVKGLHWMGLPQMRRVSSSLLNGVGLDAKDIVAQIQKNQPAA